MVVVSQNYNVTCHQANFGQLDIVFQVQEDTLRSPGKKPANLPSAVWPYFTSCGQTQPPSCATIATIQRVNISLDFSPTVPGPHRVPNSTHPQKLLVSEYCGRPHDKCISGTPEDESFGNFNVSMSEPETWESLDDDSPFSSQQSVNSSSSTDTCPESVLRIGRVTSISLIDQGFRDLFASKHLLKTHGQKSNVEKEEIGLIELAPSIFNPEYRTVRS